MYSTHTVEADQAKLEATTKVNLVRYPIGDVQSRKADLAKLVKEGGGLLRDLTQDERAFVRNEQLLCTIDFRYWLTRYAHLLLDQGGLGTFADPWESQEIILRVIADLEDKMVDAALRGESVDGILIFLTKARQLGATALARAISCHSMLARKHTRAMAASVDEDKVLELYDRDKLILDNLPFYLHPSIGFDEKAQHIFFDKLGSRVIYQLGTQKSGLGQGRQFDVTHLTECASWPYPGIIEHDWMPTIPQSLRAFALLESSPQGRGNWWHQAIQKLQKHRLRRWNLIYIPYYAEQRKYNATPPPDWAPSEEALAHAQRVYETSERYVGRKVMLSKEKLYWWQSTRDEYYTSNNLAVFYTNFSATIEESFQHREKSAFSFESLEHYRQRIASGQSYRIDTLPVKEVA
jgi:hypothetical protein